MIEEFIQKFTDKKIKGVIKIRNRFYTADKPLLDLASKIDKEPYAIGAFLGEIKNNKFCPSIALLELLSELSDRKVFVNGKAEWLFLCRRDVLRQSIMKSNAKQGLVLVQNEHDENLGYGEIKGKIVKNLLDRGDFLRRESL